MDLAVGDKPALFRPHSLRREYGIGLARRFESLWRVEAGRPAQIGRDMAEATKSRIDQYRLCSPPSAGTSLCDPTGIGADLGEAVAVASRVA